MAQKIPGLRRRLSVVLGRTVQTDELQSDILIELLETLERTGAESPGGTMAQTETSSSDGRRRG
jgi:hypothetical protein